ncbi:MAG: FkbM family methyltransferase [Woeseiaceae bacterium]|nr:FkbM family methyltransferase [Woeseiaceae bacterium]
MDFEEQKELYRRLEAKDFKPTHVAEVGVYLPETSNVIDYIRAGVRATLVEPDPVSLKKIHTMFGDSPNVSIVEVAVYDRVGQITLSQRDASTFVSDLEASPAIVNDGYQQSEEDQFTVDCTTFDRIDDESIDLLSVDTEGSEWYVLETMRSRPRVISIETHGARYVNPHIDKIQAWMRDNGYVIFYKNRTDSVYVQPDAIKVSLPERIGTQIKSAWLTARRLRKELQARLAGAPQ